MSSSYGIDSFIMGMPGIGLLALPILIGFLAAPVGRRWIACLPGTCGIVFFAIACTASLYTTGKSDVPGYLFMAAMGGAALLVVPSILVLRNKWLGAFHLLTISGLLFIFFVGAMAISHDWL
jgi:hypothetical protein